MARIADVLGLDSDADATRRWRGGCVTRGGANSSGRDGRLTPDTQANHVRALAFGLVPQASGPPWRPGWSNWSGRPARTWPPASSRRRTCCRCWPTPATSTSPTICSCQDTEPSWLLMIDRGATTMWERWDGIDADGVAHESLNHYAKGAVVSFLHRYVAGLRTLLEPAYRRFRVRPRPGGGVTSASAAHESPYGRI